MTQEESTTTINRQGIKLAKLLINKENLSSEGVNKLQIATIKLGKTKDMV
jgi:hypothetical protein